MSKHRKELAFFTIVARNYVPYARVLCKSIHRHHPDARIYVFMSDKGEQEMPIADGVKLVWCKDLDLPSFDRFTFRYDVMEFSTAIKPYAFRWLANNTECDQFVYLDPDILVLSPLEHVLESFEQGASAVLTPHLTARVDDEFLPNERTMLQVGVYNLGFIGIRRSQAGRELIDWWCDRLEHGAIVSLETGLFTDQKWADLIPSLFADVRILRNPGYNAAYWNIAARKITQSDGSWLANGELIRFFHFSGVIPNDSKTFSKHQNRHSVDDIGELRDLLKIYLDGLLENGSEEMRNIPYGFSKLEDGTPIHPAMREYFRRFVDNQKNPIEDPYQRLSISYFDKLEPSLPANKLVSRFMYGLYLLRADLRDAFNLKDQHGQRQFGHWFAAQGEHFGIERFSTSVASRLAELAVHADPGIPDGEHSRVFKLFARAAHWSYSIAPGMVSATARMFPASFVEKVFLNGPLVAQGTTVTHRALKSKSARASSAASTTGNRRGNDRSRRVWSGKGPDGINLVGYSRGDFGVAQNLRAVAGALKSVDFPFDISRVDTRGAYREENRAFEAYETDETAFEIRLLCVNADQTERAIAECAVDDDDYRIGYWFWELEKFPDEWMRIFDLVDEVWAPSKFVYDCLKKVAPIPVTYVPVAVGVELKAQYVQSDFSLPDEKFLYLYSFDFHSFSDRKNPGAALKAFLEAFPQDPGVGLVIKTINGEKHQDEYIRLLEIATRDTRITVLNSAYSRDQMYGLMDVCDCYVSLHRSEGFGLGLAESMCLGKPVIGTAYSGNMDFMTPENSGLVDYRMVPVGQDRYPFWLNQKWADPDVSMAARLMLRIKEDKTFRTGLVEQARVMMENQHAPEVVGKKLTDAIRNSVQRARSQQG